jgi:hypothetical protein
MRHIVFALALTMTLVSAAVAGPFEDGVRALKGGDYATVLRLWRPLAEQGHATAQFDLGRMYVTGQGVPQDYAEAMKWYRLAAAQGDARSQHKLGIMYTEGNGVPQDYAEATKWYAAEDKARSQECTKWLMRAETQFYRKIKAKALNEQKAEEITERLDEADALCTEGKYRKANATLSEVKKMIANASGKTPDKAKE